MAKRGRPRGSSSSFKVKIARLGTAPVEVTLGRTHTVAAALLAAGIDPSGSEDVWVDGEQTDRDDVVEAGEILTIITPKAAA